MPHGYHGKILHLDLTRGQFRVEEPPEAFYREYLGGSALALTYILCQTPPGIDAFDPRNTLVLAASALTGAPLAGLSCLTVAAKSPLTGCKSDGRSIDPVKFEQARQAYYRLAGWDPENGTPRQGKWETLGLEWV